MLVLKSWTPPYLVVRGHTNGCGHTSPHAASSGVAGAKAGTLSFLVGGTTHAFGRASPVLAQMGHRIIHCGASGAGLAAKICNNLVLGVEQIVVSEAMLLGQKLGLDPAVLAGVINSSTGGCWASSINNPAPGSLPDKAPPCERDYEGGFQTALMLKVEMGLFFLLAGQALSSCRTWVLLPRLVRQQEPLCHWRKLQSTSTLT